jgi:ketosteroid isomerase-like protein
MIRSPRIRLTLLLVMTVALALAATAVAVTMPTRPASRSVTSSAADQVRAAERALMRATVDADATAAAQVLADDFQLINPLGQPQTREDYLATLAGVIDFLTWKPVSEIEVRLYGDAAVARFESAFDLVAFGERLTHRAWHTDVFERRHGRWQLVRAQTTAVPNNPALVIEALKPVGPSS